MENIKTTSLYGGSIKIKFFEEDHLYFVNGEMGVADGVTTILGIKDKSKALVPWALGLYKDYLLQKLPMISKQDIEDGAELSKKELDVAGGFGTKAHYWCECYIKEKLGIPGWTALPIPTDPDLRVAAEAFLQFVSEHHVIFVSSEKIIYSKKYNYIGTTDIIAYVDGELCILDIKTSTNIYNYVRCQLAAYAKGDEEETGCKYQGRWVLRLPKETEKEYKARMKRKGWFNYPPYQTLEAVKLDENLSSIEEDFRIFLAMKEVYQWDKKTDFYLLKKEGKDL